MDWVVAYLRRRSRELADLINRVIFEIRYTFPRENIRNLPADAEFRYVKGSLWKPKPKLVRTGLPQGLSISPILATMVVDSLPPLEGLVMYADDGLIIREKEEDEEIKKWFTNLETFGIKLEPSKSGRVGSKFKFTGVIFDLEEESVTYNESTFC